MEMRQLRYFLAVADELHFRRAAERLHMSQPPLSIQIKALEKELGCTLLTRDRQGVQLTPSGRVFRDDVRNVLAGLERSVVNARNVEAGFTGIIRVNFVESALLALIPPLVQRFRDERPNVAIELRARPTNEQVEAVLSGQIDLGLVPLPIAEDGIRTNVVLREHAVAVLPVDHELARMDRVPLGMLAEEPFVFFPREQAPGVHDRLIRALTEANRSPTIAQTAAETQTIIGLVAAGIGVSLVQSSVQRLSLPHVTYRPVSPSPTIELAAITAPGKPSPPTERFEQLAGLIGSSLGA